MQKNVQTQGLKESIAMAFNLGVWLKQQKGNEANVSEAAEKLKGMIYWNLNNQYGDNFPSDLLNSNVEYYLQIALLGYILPEVCLPDDDFKRRLLTLMEAKADAGAPQEPTVQHSGAAITIN